MFHFKYKSLEKVYEFIMDIRKCDIINPPKTFDRDCILKLTCKWCVTLIEIMIKPKLES